MDALSAIAGACVAFCVDSLAEHKWILAAIYFLLYSLFFYLAEKRAKGKSEVSR